MKIIMEMDTEETRFFSLFVDGKLADGLVEVSMKGNSSDLGLELDVLYCVNPPLELIERQFKDSKSESSDGVPEIGIYEIKNPVLKKASLRVPVMGSADAEEKMKKFRDDFGRNLRQRKS